MIIKQKKTGGKKKKNSIAMKIDEKLLFMLIDKAIDGILSWGRLSFLRFLLRKEVIDRRLLDRHTVAIEISKNRRETAQFALLIKKSLENQPKATLI